MIRAAAEALEVSHRVHPAPARLPIRRRSPACSIFSPCHRPPNNSRYRWLRRWRRPAGGRARCRGYPADGGRAQPRPSSPCRATRGRSGRCWPSWRRTMICAPVSTQRIASGRGCITNATQMVAHYRAALPAGARPQFLKAGAFKSEVQFRPRHMPLQIGRFALARVGVSRIAEAALPA